MGIELHYEDEVITIPENGFTLESGAYFFWPFNMDMEGALLKYATVQPLCKIKKENELIYFFLNARAWNRSMCGMLKA